MTSPSPDPLDYCADCGVYLEDQERGFVLGGVPNQGTCAACSWDRVAESLTAAERARFAEPVAFATLERARQRRLRAEAARLRAEAARLRDEAAQLRDEAAQLDAVLARLELRSGV